MTKIPLENNDLFEPNQLDLIIWEAAYPHIDVPALLLRIASWNHSNPARRKTQRGIRRHIDLWLADAEKQALEGLQNGAKARLDVDSWSRKALGIASGEPIRRR